MTPLDWLNDELSALQQRDLQRELPPPLGPAGPIVEVDGRPLVNFASNDYLNLAADPRLTDAAASSLGTEGFGRGASPLVCGRADRHVELEDRLAQFEGCQAALLFPTGYAANAGTIPALVDQDDAIYGDAKNHASIIDGCRLSRAAKHIYPHGDVATLERMLQDGKHFRRRLIVTDTLFSMDGDLAPLPALAELARTYGAMLMVDEAHATGVYGSTGRGVVEHFAGEHPQLHDDVSIRVGTLSKALGSSGGFVSGSQHLIDWLANRARTYVFSTAHPAAASAAACAALDAVEADPSQGARLLQRAEHLRSRLRERGWNTGASESQIIPLAVGSAAQSVDLADRLRSQGYWVPAIRPPSVPDGESLLRLSLTSGHTEAMVDGLLAALDLA